jgi:KEOPS complex subunit Cgi121
MEKKETCGLNYKYKIFAGKVGISNGDDFLAVLKNIAFRYNVTIQAMDATLIAGEEHVNAAVKKALRAVEKGDNITNNISMEILLYAAGEKQIERALQMGVSKGEKKVVIVNVEVNADADLEIVAEEVKRRLGIKEEPVSALELETRDKERKERIKKFFNVTDVELKAVGAQKLKKLVLERVAMLDVLK